MTNKMCHFINEKKEYAVSIDHKEMIFHCRQIFVISNFLFRLKKKNDKFRFDVISLIDTTWLFIHSFGHCLIEKEKKTMNKINNGIVMYESCLFFFSDSDEQ